RPSRTRSAKVIERIRSSVCRAAWSGLCPHAAADGRSMVPIAGIQGGSAPRAGEPTPRPLLLVIGERSTWDLSVSHIRIAQYGTKHGHASGKLLALRRSPRVEFAGVCE